MRRSVALRHFRAKFVMFTSSTILLQRKLKQNFRDVQSTVSHVTVCSSMIVVDRTQKMVLKIVLLMVSWRRGLANYFELSSIKFGPWLCHAKTNAWMRHPCQFIALLSIHYSSTVLWVYSTVGQTRFKKQCKHRPVLSKTIFKFIDIYTKIQMANDPKFISAIRYSFTGVRTLHAMKNMPERTRHIKFCDCWMHSLLKKNRLDYFDIFKTKQ